MTKERLEKEVLAFLAYISNYLQKPEYAIVPYDQFKKQPGSAAAVKTQGPPEVISLVYDASKGANISVNDAWNMPIGQAYIAQAFRLIELGANLDFMDEKEREFQATLKEHLAKQQQKQK